MERQKTQNRQHHWKRIKLLQPDFKTHCTTIVIKRVWYWWKNRHSNQWNRIRSPEIDHTNIVNWHLTKEQRQFNGEKIIFSTNVLKQVTSTCKKISLDTDLTPFTKVNSKRRIHKSKVQNCKTTKRKQKI